MVVVVIVVVIVVVVVCVCAQIYIAYDWDWTLHHVSAQQQYIITCALHVAHGVHMHSQLSKYN